MQEVTISARRPMIEVGPNGLKANVAGTSLALSLIHISQCFTKELFQLMVIPSSVLGGVLVMGILSVVRMDVVIC